MQPVHLVDEVRLGLADPPVQVGLAVMHLLEDRDVPLVREVHGVETLFDRWAWWAMWNRVVVWAMWAWWALWAMRTDLVGGWAFGGATRHDEGRGPKAGTDGELEPA